MKNLLLLVLLGVGATVHSQKIKGSKNVTTAPVELPAYTAIEVTDDIDVFLTLATDASAEIEADDNLHEVLTASVSAGTLYISANQPLGSFRQFSLKLHYTSDLKKITIKGEAEVTAMNDINVAELELVLLDNAKIYGNLRATKLTMSAGGKSKSELNINAPQAALEMTGNASVKALIASENLNLDLYQKANGNIEGDANLIRLRLDNNARLTGKNLTGKLVELTAEGYSETSIDVVEKAVIAASGKSSIELYGEPKIEINTFTDAAVISKKNNKVR